MKKKTEEAEERGVAIISKSDTEEKYVSKEDLEYERVRLLNEEKKGRIAIQEGRLVKPEIFMKIIDNVFIRLNLAISQPSKELMGAIIEMFKKEYTPDMQLSELKTILTDYYRGVLNLAAEGISKIELQEIIDNAVKNVR